MSERENLRNAALDAGFSRRAVFWLVATISASFLVALLLIAFGEGSDGERGGRSSSFSLSALGHHALVGFLQRSGVRVEVQRSRRAGGARAGAATFVIEPDPDLEDSAPQGYLREVVRNARRGDVPLVFVLPKWRGREVRTLDGVVVRSAVLRPEIEVEAALAATGIPELASLDVEVGPTGNAYLPLLCATTWGEAADLEILSPQVLAAAPGLRPVVWAGQGLVVAQVAVESEPFGGPPVYVISDPDILNNHGLGRGDNALIVHRLIEACLSTKAIVLDEVVHGYGREEGLLAEALRFPLVLPVLQGAAVLLLVLWRGTGRFGKPLPVPPSLGAGKLELIHATAGLLSYRGRVVDSSLAYFDETVAELGRRFHVGAGAKGEELLSRLERLSEERGIPLDLARLRKRLVSLSGSEVHVRAAAVRIACELHRWREQMMAGDDG